MSVAYGKRQVLSGIRLSLPQGIFVLQGANGTGKSTLLRVLAGAQSADDGEVFIDGLSMIRTPDAARRRLSYVPDESSVYPFMTGTELLRFVASAKQAALDEAVVGLVGDFDLAPQVDVRFDAMSLGTQKKMLLCAAWIGTPRVIFMDEPSNGLDSRARERLADQIRSWRNRGTVLFTTHDCDLVAATDASVLVMEELLRAGCSPAVPS
ncbi:MAG: ATP-binding cassette domain-containing protein [Bradyrhizobiaceae bacterium]|nr:ATP-binding cassette domain-containing protein [Bradyrhizobiaceae bacterium]